MNISIIRPHELGASDIVSWRSMQARIPSHANPFLAPEFTITAGNFRPNARVAVLSEGSSIVGFFPFERNRRGAGTPIAPGLTDCHGLVHNPGIQWDPRELLRACNLSVWRFDHLVDDQRPFEKYRTAVKPSPIMDLTDGFDTYYKELVARSPQFCKNLLRKERKLTREVGHLRFAPDSNDDSAFRALLAWKSTQYQRTGQVDIFTRPWVADLIEALFNSRNNYFGGLLSVLYADNIPVGAHFGIRHGGILAHWFPAYDTRFSQYSPGLIMHMRLAEFTPNVGVRLIDMGTGIKRYKEELKNGEIFVGAGIVPKGYLQGATYRARDAGGSWLTKTVKQNPLLFQGTSWLRKRYRQARNAYSRSLSSRLMQASL